MAVAAKRWAERSTPHPGEERRDAVTAFELRCDMDKPLTLRDDYGDTGIVQNLNDLDPDVYCHEHGLPLERNDYGHVMGMCAVCLDNYEPRARTFDEALGAALDAVK